jgi:hypothetical protein
MAETKKRVVRVDQSPMNAAVWVLQLECGHDIYRTQKARPSRERTWTDKATGERMCGPRFEHCERCAVRESSHV